ncbi:MAG: phosphatase PAP2 family protein [Chitinophagales bacterium]
MTWIELDHSLYFLVNHMLANPVLDWLAPLIRNKNTWIPFYVVACIFLYKRNKKEALQLVLLTVVAVVFTDVISNNLKHAFHRLRPCAVGEGRLLLKQCSNSFSFTSNHAANHFAIAVMVSLWFRQTALTFALLVWAAVIAFSQVYVGLHYPADVTAGAALGVLVSSVVYVSFEYSPFANKKQINEL